MLFRYNISASSLQASSNTTRSTPYRLKFLTHIAKERPSSCSWFSWALCLHDWMFTLEHPHQELTSLEANSEETDLIWRVCYCSKNPSCSVISYAFSFFPVSHPSPPADHPCSPYLGPLVYTFSCLLPSPSGYCSQETPSQAESATHWLGPWTPSHEHNRSRWKHQHRGTFTQILTRIWYCTQYHPPFVFSVCLAHLQDHSWESLLDLWCPTLSSFCSHLTTFLLTSSEKRTPLKRPYSTWH